MKKGIFGMFGAMIMACAGGGSAWQSVAKLGSDLKVTSMLEVSDAVVVFGFSGGAFVPLDQRQATIVHVSAAGVVESSALGSGWIATAGARGQELWAVHATPKPGGAGSDYALLVSQDGGRKWSAQGGIPAQSVTGVAVEGAGCGWVIGVQTLLRTCDQGRTWSRVAPPSFLRGVAQPIASTGYGALVLGGAGLYATADAGVTWSKLADADVTATDGAWVVAKGADFAQVGLIQGAKVTWTARIEESVQPDAIVAHEQRVWIRAAPLAQDAGRRVLVFESQDSGASFERQRVADSSDTDTVALGAQGQLWWVDLSRGLRLRQP